MSKLFSSFKIKNITLRNKIVMSPMCQYSAKDGFATDWHLVHYGSRAIGGCGAIILEATAVAPEGRITYADLGIWDNLHIEPLKKITSFLENYGAVPGIQLAHAGRKASENVSWLGNGQIFEEPNGWQTVAPSPIPFDPRDKVPTELSIDDIKQVVFDFKEAAIRAKHAGFKIFEIHAAHGYLIHQFLSPLSNQRKDQYGGVFENRTRLLIEIIDAINSIIDENHSLWVRISATDWTDNGWNENESVELAKILKLKNVDIIDVSTGGNVPRANIPVGPNYQVPFCEMIKRESNISTAAVGLITSANQAEKLLDEGKCDLIMIGRELLRDPYFPINGSIKLDDKMKVIHQYERAY